MKTKPENISFKYPWVCFAFLIFLSGITTKPVERKSIQSKFEWCCTNISVEKQLCNPFSSNSDNTKNHPSERSNNSSVELEEELDDCQYPRFFNLDFPPNSYCANCTTNLKNRSALVFHPEKDSPPPQV